MWLSRRAGPGGQQLLEAQTLPLRLASRTTIRIMLLTLTCSISSRSIIAYAVALQTPSSFAVSSR